VRRSPPDLSLAPGLGDVQDRCRADDGGHRTRRPVRRQALLKRDATIDRICRNGRVGGQLFRSQGQGGWCARCVSAGNGGDEVGEHERAEAYVDE
jgi:hypothetical protein